MYMGAAHYYFWKGLEQAVNGPIMGITGHIRPEEALVELLEVMCPVGGKAAESSREAFSWGFLFGCEMTPEDFEDFFQEIPESDIVLDDMGRRVTWN